MNTHKRRINLPYPKGPDGKPVCRCGCGRPIGKGRRLWHSQECVDRYKIRNDPNFARQKLFERDGGICQECGLDTVAVEEKLQKLSSPRWNTGITDQEREAALDDYRDYRAWLYSRGFDPTRSLWEADHTIEVAAGGAELGLENLRTLCMECHKRKTAGFAAQRAEARRLAKQPELPIMVTKGRPETV